MTTSDVIQNSGNFFIDDFNDKLANANLYPQDKLETMFEHLSEHFERHQSHLHDEATAEQVGFFIANRAMHIIGYTHSHNEPLPDDENTHVDYTLFDSPESFTANMAARATQAFFSEAVAIAKVVAWATDLDNAMINIGDENAEEQQQEHVLYQLDEFLRQTNLQWAILTNGRLWRLFHKNTISMLNTFIQADLVEIIKSKDIQMFKIFASAFGAKAITVNNTGSCPNRALLN